MQDSPTVSIIIPAYNEEPGLGPLLEKMQSMGYCSRYEVIVVNDGSTDKTAEVAKRYPIRVLQHEVNKGYGASLKTGVRKAKGSLILMLDSDGQHDPSYLDKAIELLSDYDMVIGERGVDSFQVRNRKGGKKLIRLVGEYLVEQKLPDYNSGFRGFHKNLLQPMLHLMPNGFSFSTTSTLAFLKEGYSIGTFPIKVEERKGRASNIKFFRDGTKTLLLLFRIIMLFNPLKVFFPGSLLFTVAGLSWGFQGFIVFQRFSNSAIILVTLGMLLFFFGLLADQIALLNRKKN